MDADTQIIQMVGLTDKNFNYSLYIKENKEYNTFKSGQFHRRTIREIEMDILLTLKLRIY